MNKEDNFREVLADAKHRKVSYIWSGELRNESLCECLKFAERTGLLELEWIEMEQESGYKVRWL